MAFFKPDFLQFFIDLAPNNNKEWFDINRKRYEQIIKEPFKKFVQHIIDELSKTDGTYKNLEAKDCIFRINRDIRFAKDKSPYKMMVSAVIAPGGKKSKAINGVYFEFGPEYVRVYGGIYEIEKDDLLIIREGIAGNVAKFQKAYNNPIFTEVFGAILGDKNKIISKELKEAAEKEPLIFNKQWYFYKQFEPKILLSEDLDQVILKCYKAGRPVEEYFNDLINRN